MPCTCFSLSFSDCRALSYGARTKRIGTPKGPVSPAFIPPAPPQAATLIRRAMALLPVQSTVPLLPLASPSTNTRANPTICNCTFVPPGTLAAGQNGVPLIVALQTSHTGHVTNDLLVDPTVPFGR